MVLERRGAADAATRRLETAAPASRGRRPTRVTRSPRAPELTGRQSEEAASTRSASPASLTSWWFSLAIGSGCCADNCCPKAIAASASASLMEQFMVGAISWPGSLRKPQTFGVTDARRREVKKLGINGLGQYGFFAGATRREGPGEAGPRVDAGIRRVSGAAKLNGRALNGYS